MLANWLSRTKRHREWRGASSARCGAVLLLLVLPVHAASGQTEPGPLYDFSAVTQRVQGWVDRRYYPGAAVLIARHHRVIYERCFGRYNPETSVYIASAGKWLAAAAIMSVVDEGKLSLDDPVAKWLPQLKGAKGRATLRQLLSHTSGYRPYQPEDQPQDAYQTLEESVAHIVPLPAVSSPGERFDYGGLAMQVAGRMAEIATGKEWEALFQARIARPLHMTNTHFTPVDSAGGHNPMLGGGAHSTLHDYANFLSMIAAGGLFEGRRVLSAKAIAEMQAGQVRGAVVPRDNFVERVRGGTHNGIYGLGEWRERVDDRGNALLISSPSWAGAYPWIDKAADIYGVILAHVNVDQAQRAHFSGFFTSPVLAMMAREVVAQGTVTLPHFAAGIVPSSATDLYYEAAGQGEPLVLVHAHSVDRRMWDPQFAELARHYRVIRYDLRGYGLSDMPEERRPFLHVGDLHRLLQELGIPRAHFAGLSLGAFVVGDFLALYPEAVLSATIACGGIQNSPGPDTPPTEQEREQRIRRIDALRKQGIEAYKQRWLEAVLRSCGPRRNAIRAELWTMIEDWSAWQPLHLEIRSLLGRKAADRLSAARVNVPVMIVVGQDDTESARRSSEELLALIPGAKKVVIQGAGHFPNLETPGEFNHALLEFLDETHSK